MDLAFFKAINSLAGQFGFLDWVGVFFAQYLPWLTVLVFFVFAFRQKSWKGTFSVLMVSLFSLVLSRGIITETIRFFYDRPRPFEALSIKPLFLSLNPSFPSGHAVIFFTLAFFVFYFSKKLGFLFLISACLISLGRVFAGVHWPTDILGGVAISLFSFWLTKALFKNYLINIKIEKPSVKTEGLISTDSF